VTAEASRSPSEPEAARPSRLRWMTPARMLLLAVAAYFVISFALSWLRAAELQTTTWDQGVYQQALWMTAHGRPFYETADIETGGYGSLLEVHSVFILYLLAPVYGLLPYQTTLFAVQSGAVALAAVPVYLLARDATGSERLGLVGAVAYLAWTPTLSSNLYDFHPEAFLPLELLTLVLLWGRGRYLTGAVAALAAFLTFEFAPVITLAIGVYFLLPEGGTSPGPAGLPILPRFPRALSGWLRQRRVQYSLLLAVASVAAYVALLYVRLDLLPPVLGFHALPAPPTGYVIGGTPGALGLSVSNLSVGLAAKLEYWFLLVALLGFVPLLAPRALILTVPWFAFTMLSTNTNYVILGFQYGFIAGATLMVAFALGLPLARRAMEALLASRPAPQPVRPARSRSPLARLRGRAAAIVLVGALLAVNLALSPVDPAMQNQGLGSGYRLTYAPAPGASDVVQLSTLIPTGASVLATDDLFPLVTNDANAYSFSWVFDPVLSLPFGPERLPQYVFLSEARTPVVPPWLSLELYNSSAYGVRGVAWSSPEGPVLLFEAGYRGSTEALGPTPPTGGAFYGAGIASPTDGLVVTAPGSRYSTVVESVPGATGTVWYGPGLALPAGNYTVAVSLRAVPATGSTAPAASTPVLWLGALAFAQPTYFGWSIPFGDIAGGNFTTITFSCDVPAPTIELDVQGQLLDGGVQVTLNYVEVAPA
jgi:uncharacterized membrane protein